MVLVVLKFKEEVLDVMKRKDNQDDLAFFTTTSNYRVWFAIDSNNSSSN